MKVTTIGIPTIAPKVGSGSQDHPRQPADDESRDDRSRREPEAESGAPSMVPAPAPGLGQYVNKVV